MPNPLELWQQANPEATRPVELNAAVLAPLLGGIGLGEAQAAALPSNPESTGGSTGFGESLHDWSQASEVRSSAAELFAYIGIDVPSLISLEAAGISFAKLREAHSLMEGLNLEPQLAIAPTGLDLDQWKNLYSADNLPGVNPTAGGLWASDAVTSGWAELQELEASHPATKTIASLQHTKWQVGVFPTTNKPSVVNVDHRGGVDGATPPKLQQVIDRLKALGINYDPADYLHPTISIYLTLQANRLKVGQEPIDAETYTWLSDTLSNSSRAPVGGWMPGVSRVLLVSDGVGYRDGGLGVRLPVWG